MEYQPGSFINPQEVTSDLDLGHHATREALKLLVHDNLLEVKSEGLYVRDIDMDDLKLISEIRVLLEGYSARFAARRATPDDLLIIETLIQEQSDIPEDDQQQWFEIDHKLHQAIARAAHNHYLAQSLEDFFTQSQRLWNLVLPEIDFLASAVHEHKELFDALRSGNEDEAEMIMQEHVKSFYARIQDILSGKNE